MKIDFYKILIASEDKNFLEKSELYFSTSGYSAQTADNGDKIFELISGDPPDVVILADALQDGSGIELCRKIRASSKYDNVLILFISKHKNDFIHIESFRSGADDFICYPVSPQILNSRLNALLRRAKKQEKNIISLNAFTIDPFQFVVTVEGKIISLAKKEFEVLYLLASRPGELFSRSEILDKIWGETVLASDRTIDVHIRKIRKKLNLECINTVKGIGYKLSF